MDEMLAELMKTLEQRPVQPPQMPEDAPWADTSAPVADRVAAVLAELTLEEKSSLLYGRGLRVTAERHVWQAWVKGNDRLGIPDVTQGDSPAAPLVGPPNVTQIPSETSLGASFKPEVARKAACVIGQQVRRLGYGVWHAPTLDVTRDSRHGRSHENFSEDPFLNSVAGEGYVRGIADADVVPDIKHVGMNAVETDRLVTNYEIDRDRLVGHYLAPFRSVIGNVDVPMVMTAYAKIDGVHVNDVPDYFDMLRQEWGFEGVARNDAMAARSLPSLGYGLDQEFRDVEFFGDVLIEAVRRGEVDEAVVDTAVTRILTMMFETGLVDRAPVPVQWEGPTDEETAAAREAAVAGVVLMKNEGAVLPLPTDNTATIAVFGPAADDNSIAGGPTRPIQGRDTFIGALRERLAGSDITYLPGADPADPSDVLPGYQAFPASALSHAGQPGARVEYLAADGTVMGESTGVGLSLEADEWSLGTRSEVAKAPKGATRARWSATWEAEAGEYGLDAAGGGRLSFTVDGAEVLVHEGNSMRNARSETTITVEGGAHEIVVDYLLPDESLRSFVDASAVPLKVGVKLPVGAASPAEREAAALAAKADVAIVVVRDISGEGMDRLTLRLPGRQDELVRAVAAANPRTIVVMQTGNAVLTPWRDDVAGIVEGWYGGSRGNTAIVDVLVGDREPAGRLPVTFPKSDEDLPTFTPERFPGVAKHIVVDEQATGYRYFGTDGAPEAAFPFGHGLAYTTFALSGVDAPADARVAAAAARTGRRDESIAISAQVTNTGDRVGVAVAQLYVRAPGGVDSVLKAFASLTIEPGQTSVADLSVPWADLAVYTDGAWAIPAGVYEVGVGFDSRNIEWSGQINVAVD